MPSRATYSVVPAALTQSGSSTPASCTLVCEVPWPPAAGAGGAATGTGAPDRSSPPPIPPPPSGTGAGGGGAIATGVSRITRTPLCWA